MPLQLFVLLRNTCASPRKYLNKLLCWNFFRYLSYDTNTFHLFILRTADQASQCGFVGIICQLCNLIMGSSSIPQLRTIWSLLPGNIIIQPHYTIQFDSASFPMYFNDSLCVWLLYMELFIHYDCFSCGIILIAKIGIVAITCKLIIWSSTLGVFINDLLIFLGYVMTSLDTIHDMILWRF